MFDSKPYGGQLNIIDDHYSIYITTDIKGDTLLSIAHNVLSEEVSDGPTLCAKLFTRLLLSFDDDDLAMSNLKINNTYDLFYNITITIDLKHNIVEVDGGDLEDDPKVKRYNRYKMTIDYFIKEFFNEAVL